jgi:HEAT repeat protein
LTPGELLTFCESPHQDVREVGVQLVGLLPAEQAAPVLADLILDESREVRTVAITQIGCRGLPGWQQILGQSLKDPTAEVQRAAADTLLSRNDPESRELLTRHLSVCQSPELAAYIRARLSQPAPVQSRVLPPGGVPGRGNIRPLPQPRR